MTPCNPEEDFIRDMISFMEENEDADGYVSTSNLETFLRSRLETYKKEIVTTQSND